MFPYKLLMANIPYSQSEKLVRAAMENGCTGGTVLQARSLAETNLSALLGLQENSRELVLMIVENSLALSVISAVKKALCREKRNFGQLYSLEAGNFFKSGTNWELESESEVQNENLEVPMEKENQKTEKSNGSCSAMEMLTVIVNKGYAEDIMYAARKAGAGGGTVLNARGTAKETDERFFGVHIVPEKEMLVILIPSEKKQAVLKAVKELKCLKENGMGIVYSSPVKDFTMLGKTKQKKNQDDL